MKFPLVHVAWTDASKSDNSWQSVKSLAPRDLGCETVGWIIHEDADSITLAASLTLPEDENQTACGDMTIPRHAIISVRPLAAGAPQQFKP